MLVLTEKESWAEILSNPSVTNKFFLLVSRLLHFIFYISFKFFRDGCPLAQAVPVLIQLTGFPKAFLSKNTIFLVGGLKTVSVAETSRATL